MLKKLKLLFILLLALGLLSCNNQKNIKHSAPPEYLLDPNACSIIKNSSISFDDKKAQNLWFGINKAVVDYSAKELLNNGYAIRKLFFDPAKAVNALNVVTAAMENYKCRRLIQIKHVHNAPHDFGYDVDILVPDIRDFTPGSTSSYKLLSIYDKKYRFPFTKESFDNLIVSDLGKKIATDILISKALTIR